MNKQPGYILFMTFSILALCAALVSAFMMKGMLHKQLTSALLEQEKLQQLAVSVPALAQSFLAFSVEDCKDLPKESNAASPDPKSPQGENAQTSFAHMLLKKILPVVNISQTFNLKDINKDIAIQIDLIFFAEAGKINLNGLYDLINKKFYNEGVVPVAAPGEKPLPVKDGKIFTTWLFDKIAAMTEKPSLMGPFVEHVTQRKIPFNDVTELLQIKEFADCFADTVFYQEPVKNASGVSKQKLYLTDIFTVASENDTIQPWLLSPSVCALLDIPAQESKHKKSDEKKENTFDISSFKEQAEWQKDWDSTVKELHGVSYATIPEQVRAMFAQQFSATVFSVLVTISPVTDDIENKKTVQVFAVLKEKKLPDSSIEYDVIKIYHI